MAQKIKIAVVGVGNCASSLIQGIYYYKNIKGEIPGILHQNIGPYSISDIEVVAAFDIDERKVGRDVSGAIFAKPNNTIIFEKNVPFMNVKVMRGPTLDGFAEHMNEFDEDLRFVESKANPVDVVSILKSTKPDVLINYLPVGSQKATEYYADCCLNAGVSYINAIPVFIASEGPYAAEFEKRGLVCIGDDIKSQVGATIIHRVLTDLFEKRGIKVKRTYQLNMAGNTDFLNMLDRKRLGTKKISKTEAVQSQLKKPLDKNNIHVGPSDFIPWQKDNKICFIRMEGEQFGGVPMNLDLRLSVEDSPNSAGVMIDLIRCVKLAIDRGLRGYQSDISAFGFKHPKIQYTDDEACKRLESFIRGVK
jgi:myo-inositol-1-phosphate synthase